MQIREVRLPFDEELCAIPSNVCSPSVLVIDAASSSTTVSKMWRAMNGFLATDAVFATLKTRQAFCSKRSGSLAVLALILRSLRERFMFENWQIEMYKSRREQTQIAQKKGDSLRNVQVKRPVYGAVDAGIHC